MMGHHSLCPDKGSNMESSSFFEYNLKKSLELRGIAIKWSRFSPIDVFNIQA